MADVLKLKLRLVAHMFWLRGKIRYPSLAPFSHSDLNLQMESYILLVREGLFRVSAINWFNFSILCY